MNKDKPELISFSIIIASFNCEKYIEDAIKSVISQTYENWELLVLDDASCDNSIEKITPFLGDNRISLIRHKKNQGAGKTFRDALNYVSNEIIGVLDCDDALHYKALEIIAKEYKKNPECGMIYSSHWICDSNLNVIKKTSLNDSADPKKTNLLERSASHFKTFKKEIYDSTPGFNPRFRMCIDSDICYKLEEVTSLKFIDVPLYYYRIHNFGVSINNKSRVILEEYIAKLNAYCRRMGKNLPNLTRREILFEYYKCVFFKITYFFTIIKEYFKINYVLKKFFKIKLNLPRNILKRYQNIRKYVLYWF